MPRKTARTPARKSSKTRVVKPTRNLPAAEVLLDEGQFGDAMADLFDDLYPPPYMASAQRPFYAMMVRKYQPKSVLDTSCRTGQTLLLLRDLGVKKLSGVDVSMEMLKLAKRRLKASCPLMQSGVRAPFTKLHHERYDFILSTKDALSLVLDDDALIKFFRDAHHHLADSGILIVETLNYEKIWKQKERFLPVMDRSLPSKPMLFTMVLDFHEELLVRNLIKLEKKEGEWYWRALSTPVRPVTRAEIEFCVKEAGFSKWGFLGGYGASSYDPAHSIYTVLIAKR